ncbi:MAG: ATP-binding protein [Promethearchaeota archaeon]
MDFRLMENVFKSGTAVTKFITGIIKRLINIPYNQIDTEINKILKKLARLIGDLDRISVFLLSIEGNRYFLSNTHEWVSNKKYSRVLDLKRFQIKASDFYTDFFLWGENLKGTVDGCVETSGELFGPRSNGDVKPKTQLYIPIISGKDIIGAIGLFSFKKSRIWTRDELDLLALIGEIIIMAIKRKLTEEELHRTGVQYENIIRSMPVGIHTYRLKEDGQFKLVNANPAADKILKLAHEKIMGKTIQEILPRVATTRNLVAFKNIMSGCDAVVEIEDVVLDIDNDAVCLSIHAFKTVENELIIAFQDITARKQVEKMLEIENAKLREINKIRNEFISTTTHELKTPLIAISGSAEFLLKNLENLRKNEVKNLIKILHRGASRLTKIINDLTNIYKLESGRLNINKIQAELVETINNCVEQCKSIFFQEDNQIKVDIPESCMVEMDPFKIEQVIINLIINAIKYTPKDGKVIISLEKKDGFVQVSVKDNGIGLTKEELKLLFTKFGKIERLDVNQRVHGSSSGLGLYISKQIIESHGGSIWAVSEGRNKGSTFIFKIPITSGGT